MPAHEAKAVKEAVTNFGVRRNDASSLIPQPGMVGALGEAWNPRHGKVLRNGIESLNGGMIKRVGKARVGFSCRGPSGIAPCILS